jgi:hypothetical protein
MILRSASGYFPWISYVPYSSKSCGPAWHNFIYTGAHVISEILKTVVEEKTLLDLKLYFQESDLPAFHQ